MNPKRFVLALRIVSCCLTLATVVSAQSKDPLEPRAKDGKKLLTATDLMKINGVGAPRISPDGTRVAYTVNEVKMEKDKEWKNVTQIWVTPLGGGKARQYTRGEKSSSAPEWSPDGTMLAFLSDREKDGERQVWMMMADGGEAWVADFPQRRPQRLSLFAGRKAIVADGHRSTFKGRRGSQEGQRRHNGDRSRHQDGTPLDLEY